ncbi:hypothetical protein [Peptoniphilus sp.]|uniref:hypothetical protein n=1 Tax=Peptoniphilus sp. TaxID=1971214 RepID=UPI003991D220
MNNFTHIFEFKIKLVLKNINSSSLKIKLKKVFRKVKEKQKYNLKQAKVNYIKDKKLTKNIESHKIGKDEKT